MSKVKLVLAIDMVNAIGDSTKKSGLPWPRISEDFKHFQNETIPWKWIVMGSKSFLILNNLTGGKLLSERSIVVLSKTITSFPNPDVKICTSVEEVQSFLSEKNYSVCGGKKVYESFVGFADEIVLTKVHDTYINADCHIDQSLFNGFLAETNRTKILRAKSESSCLVTAHYFVRKKVH